MIWFTIRNVLVSRNNITAKCIYIIALAKKNHREIFAVLLATIHLFSVTFSFNFIRERDKTCSSFVNHLV